MHSTILLGIAGAAFCATFAGGIFALRLQDKLHLVLGFSAGAVLGVALFDLLPEAIQAGGGYFSVRQITALAAASFLCYLVLDRIHILHGRRGAHHAHQEGHDAAAASHSGAPRRASLGAFSFSAHSVLDGLAIGVGFQASAAVGSIVTIAVLTHDFSDGINTVNVVLKGGGKRSMALRWLWIDALAPGLGIVSTLLISIPGHALGGILAVFTGFFLYIGASDLIPESHHAHPKFLTTGMTLLGAAVIGAAVSLAEV